MSSEIAENIYFECSEPDGPGIRKAKAFFNNLAKGCIDYSTKYASAILEQPFSYTEKQSVGMVCNALSSFTDIFLTEPPMKRKHRGFDESGGWCDFWTSYNNTDYFIELKQSYFSLGSNHITKELKNSWSSVNRQIKSFDNKKISNYSTSCSAVLLSLQLIRLHIVLKADEDLQLVLQNFNLKGVQGKIMNELNPTPSMSCLWQIDEGLVKDCYWYTTSGSTIHYPGLLFVAKFKPCQLS